MDSCECRKTIKVKLNLSKIEYKNIYNKCYESKNAYNHFLFCANFYYKFKEEIYETILTKLLTLKSFKIDIKNIISDELSKKYELYSQNYDKLKSNNKLIYNYITQCHPNIYNYNFDMYYEKFMSECKKIKGIENIHCNFMFDDIIKHILISFYKKNYYFVKNALVNHKKIKLYDDQFIKHVKNEPILFNVYTKNFEKIKDFCNKHKIKLISEQSLLRQFVYSKFKRNNVSSDIIINTFDKANVSYSSYFALRKKKILAHPPKYKDKNELFVLIFCGSRINNRDNNEEFIELQMGDKTKVKIVKPNIIKDKEQYREIKRVEIIPIQNGIEFDACIYYACNVINVNHQTNENIINENINDMISIDLGIKNLMTIYNPNGLQRIIKGNDLVNTNEYYNKKISKSVSDNIISHKRNKKTVNSKRTKKLHIKRENVINHKMDKIVSILHKKYNTKKEIIIGYNEGWKQNVNIGRNNNRKFYEIPYKKLIDKIRNKFTNTHIIEVNESYTSKCDSLALEDIKKQDKYQGKRIKRGLFKSSIGKIINADLNGAINIMRKHVNNIGVKMKKIIGFRLTNPTILKLKDS